MIPAAAAVVVAAAMAAAGNEGGQAMDVQLYDATTGQVIEEWDTVANGMFSRTVVTNPGVGTHQIKMRVRPSTGSAGCTVVGAGLTAQQGKR